METRLLFLLCVLALGRAAVILNDCQIIQTLHGKLLYDNRVTYMINKGITVKELRYLWGIVNENILQTIQRALPLRHPTRPYITELQNIFEALLRDTNEEQQVESNQVLEILERLHQSKDEVKAVTPKALLDNCYKVLYALYEEECALCNPRSDAEDTLCPPETLPELFSHQRTPCKS
ncbi:interleukin-34 isoform X4 [Rana temporaria]|uniref:interleukin-34 isoform X4 n=1 Tax=Rana temporaria TaxID=8407 RepID=UPI001AAD5605|nr:interleukin-34 isoform X4 [Rana temporaria]